MLDQDFGTVDIASTGNKEIVIDYTPGISGGLISFLAISHSDPTVRFRAPSMPKAVSGLFTGISNGVANEPNAGVRIGVVDGEAVWSGSTPLGALSGRIPMSDFPVKLRRAAV